MPILVACPGCKSRFTVSDQFAGKQGPCPKCKTLLTIPKPDDLKIHEPEMKGGKDKQGRPVLRPIAREDRKITPLKVGIVAGVVAALFAAAFLLGETLRENRLLLGAGLAVVSPLAVLAAYEFLRDVEFEPYRGWQLLLRAGICATVYAGSWGVFAILPENLFDETWKWAFVAPPFAIVCGLVCLGCFDFELGDALFHYGFFVVMTLALRWAVGLPYVWAATVAPPPAFPY